VKSAGRPAHSAEDVPINFSFAQLIPRKNPTCSLNAANATTREAWARTLEPSCGCNRTDNRRVCTMPLRLWRAYRMRAQQNRKAMQMLALSGVVRPSEVELRYTTPLLKMRISNNSAELQPVDITKRPALRRAASAPKQPLTLQLFQWLNRN
jgi:hypothetical protein